MNTEFLNIMVWKEKNAGIKTFKVQNRDSPVVIKSFSEGKRRYIKAAVPPSKPVQSNTVHITVFSIFKWGAKVSKKQPVPSHFLAPLWKGPKLTLISLKSQVSHLELFHLCFHKDWTILGKDQIVIFWQFLIRFMIFFKASV